MRERHKFLSGFDLQKLTDGFSKCDGVQIGSATTEQVCEQYATRRRQFKKTRLNWRVSIRKSSWAMSAQKRTVKTKRAKSTLDGRCSRRCWNTSAVMQVSSLEK